MISCALRLCASCLNEQVYLWYPINIITGGTTAKIMVAAKDNFLGKYIYKDTIARNLAAVLYQVTLLLWMHVIAL